MTPLAHLTCVDHPVSTLRSVIGSYAGAGVRNVLALRGDPPEGPTAPFRAHPQGLRFAVELVELTKSLGDFCVGVAAFPETHPSATSAQADAEVLAAKARAGADFAITQLFFRPEDYFRLVDRVSALGVDIPIIPGIMPITNLAQITRMAELSGAALPEEIVRRVSRFEGDPAAVRREGIAIATELCDTLLGRRRARPALLHPQQVQGHARDLCRAALGGRLMAGATITTVGEGQSAGAPDSLRLHVTVSHRAGSVERRPVRLRLTPRSRRGGCPSLHRAAPGRQQRPARRPGLRRARCRVADGLGCPALPADRGARRRRVGRPRHRPRRHRGQRPADRARRDVPGRPGRPGRARPERPRSRTHVPRPTSSPHLRASGSSASSASRRAPRPIRSAGARWRWPGRDTSFEPGSATVSAALTVTWTVEPD